MVTRASSCLTTRLTSELIACSCALTDTAIEKPLRSSMADVRWPSLCLQVSAVGQHSIMSSSKWLNLTSTLHHETGLSVDLDFLFQILHRLIRDRAPVAQCHDITSVPCSHPPDRGAISRKTKPSNRILQHPNTMKEKSDYLLPGYNDVVGHSAFILPQCR